MNIMLIISIVIGLLLSPIMCGIEPDDNDKNK
jgi:hypothetical protein